MGRSSEKAAKTPDDDPRELPLRLLKHMEEARREGIKDRVGQQIGNYRLTRLLEDNFIYLAEHIVSRNKVVVKFLPYHLEKQQFLKRTELLTKLKHPNILSILNFGIEREKDFYLVMEYAQNGSLQKHVSIN